MEEYIQTNEEDLFFGLDTMDKSTNRNSNSNSPDAILEELEEQEGGATTGGEKEKHHRIQIKLTSNLPYVKVELDGCRNKKDAIQKASSLLFQKLLQEQGILIINQSNSIRRFSLELHSRLYYMIFYGDQLIYDCTVIAIN